MSQDKTRQEKKRETKRTREEAEEGSGLTRHDTIGQDRSELNRTEKNK